jgi:hypothetical protein
MESSIFVLFLGFGFLWAMIGAIAVIAILKADGQKIQFGPWGLVVALPILIPFFAALIIGAMAMRG